MDALDSDGCPPLALPALGSFLWSRERDRTARRRAARQRRPARRGPRARDRRGRRVRRAVDFRNLGAEELGSVYESLLELHPDARPRRPPRSRSTRPPATSARPPAATTRRPSLISLPARRALDRVLDEAACHRRTPRPRSSSLAVVDPACGSGHFLIAAANRIAKRLAAVRSEDPEPSPDAIATALRDVVGRCIYGVDVNPMAVELCKVSLWMEALEPGRPLSFLDAHIKCGNSLLRASPDLIGQGIPDSAFTPTEADDRAFAGLLARRNRAERDRPGQLSLNAAMEAQLIRFTDDLAEVTDEIDNSPSDSITALRLKEARYGELSHSSSYAHARFLGDVWCAAFVQEKRATGPAITEDFLRQASSSPDTLGHNQVTAVRDLARRLRFFHWHVEFPEVFSSAHLGSSEKGARAGFDLVLGNPPWVRQESIQGLKALLATYPAYRSTADLSVFFVELANEIVRPRGYVALLTPNKWFRANYGAGLRAHVIAQSDVNLVVDFGHAKHLFPGADTFPAAVVLQRRTSTAGPASATRYVRAYDSDRAAKALDRLVREDTVDVPAKNLTEIGWRLETGATSDLLDRLSQSGLTLPEYVGSVPLVGLKSGFNEAFYIDSAARDFLVGADPACAALIQPLLRGRDIGRWRVTWADQWHIVVPSSLNHEWPWSAAPTAEHAEDCFAATYPALHDHLMAHRAKLEARGDQGKYWWELRSCDYYDKFLEPKVVVQCIAYHPRFALENDTMVLNNKAIMIPSDDLYLLAVLNSRATWWVMNRTFQKMKDGGLSVDVQYLSRLAIPEASADVRQQVASVVTDILTGLGDDVDVAALLNLERQVDKLISEAFRLSSNETAILEDSLPARDPLESLIHQLDAAA